MHIKCPHCFNPVELVAGDTETASVTCPSCGSNFALLPETAPPIPSDFGSIGQFQLQERVGRGQFGEVWKAFDETLMRNVALKLPRLPPGAREAEREYQEMFLREARSAARLRHPHIVPVHEIARTERGIIIVSDFIEGVNLAELIRHRRPDVRRSAEVLKTVALAVHYGHEQGIIHRDLKPANILVDNAGEPHITDFGLAKRRATEITVTADGKILGTPAYMSPEQARGKGHLADARSDVYSLGVILFELLTGERPFSGDQPMLIYQILNDEPKRPRALDKSIPKDLETICLRALEKNPEGRFATALEMADELDRYLRGEPIRSRPITRLERGWRWMRRHPAVSMLTSAAVFLLAALIGVSLAAALQEPEIVEHETVREVVTIKEVPENPPVEVSLTTTSGVGKITLIPMSDYDHAYELDKIIPAEDVPITRQLHPGWYLAVAEFPDGTFQEVYRRVPRANERSDPGGHRHLSVERQDDGTVILMPIRPPPHHSFTLVSFPGKEEFTLGMGTTGAAPERVVSLPPFHLATTECTPKLIREVGDSPTSVDEDFPITLLNWDVAVTLAEAAGMRLPEEAEYEFAATNGGETRYPWGNELPTDVTDMWKIQKVGGYAPDRLRDHPEVVGLFSNAGEWCATPAFIYLHDRGKLLLTHDDRAALFRVVRGLFSFQAENEPEGHGKDRLGARLRLLKDKSMGSATIGVRFAKSVRPRTRPADFVQNVTEPKRP